MGKNPPALEVGQVWRFESTDLAIIGLSKHLAEFRHCRDGRVVRSGSSDLQSIRSLQSLISRGGARLTGHLVMPDGIVKNVARPSA